MSYLDLLVMQASGMESIGLYHGKIGAALCLLAGAKYTNRKVQAYCEMVAEQLIKDVLRLPIKNIHYEDGLIGIGFALCLMIRHRWVKADLDRIFKKQNEIITLYYNNGDINWKECKDILYFFIRQNSIHTVLLENTTISFLKELGENVEHRNSHYLYNLVNNIQKYLIVLNICVENTLPPCIENALNIYTDELYDANLPIDFLSLIMLRRIASKSPNGSFYMKVCNLPPVNTFSFRTSPIWLQSNVLALSQENDVMWTLAEKMYVQNSIENVSLNYEDGVGRIILILAACMHRRANERCELSLFV